MKRFISMIVLVMFAIFTPAMSQVSVELGAGISHSQPRANGIWYQKGNPYFLKLNSQAFELNVKWRVTQHLSLIAGAVDLGTRRSDSWDTPRDSNYTGVTAHPCNGPCLPLTHYVGHGGVRGAQFLVGTGFGDDWHVEAQAGFLVYQTRWSIDVPDWYPTVNGNEALVGPITPVHTSDKRWATGTIVGVQLSRQGSPWSASLRYYRDGAGFSGHDGIWPPIWRRDTTLMVAYAF